MSSDGLGYIPPTITYDGFGWGVSYFDDRMIDSGLPLHQEQRARVDMNWTGHPPSGAFAGQSANERYQVWFTSWGWLKKGFATFRLTATVATATLGKADFRLVEAVRGDGSWTYTTLCSLQPTAATGTIVSAYGTALFSQATWYFFGLAYRYSAALSQEADVVVQLEWCYPGCTRWLPVEGSFLHPTYYHLGNWPSGIEQPLT